MASAQPERWSQRYFRGMLNILNVKIHCRGEPGNQAALVAGNHQSWLDIAVLVSLKPVTFVSKAEVRSWPLIGWLSNTGDTLYIERGAHGTTELNHKIAQRLGLQRSVVIFPEATTTRGPGVRRFQPRLFAGAIEQQCPILPFALRYNSARVPYVDDQTLAANMWDLLGEAEIHAEVHFGLPIEAGQSRNDIARRTQTWVEQSLEQAAKWTSHSHQPATPPSHSPQEPAEHRLQ